MPDTRAESRIIPADAGSTQAAMQGYPCGCGEHSFFSGLKSGGVGSSPRMRGAQAVDHQRGAIAGIIPADAGSTSATFDAYYILSDHPRGCGEHFQEQYKTDFAQGSSPRMRGARLLIPDVQSVDGIIPADAGSTVGLDLKLPDAQDHPRGCGEHTVMMLFMMSSRGSSPRMRGALSSSGMFSWTSRIIPADAGSTVVVRYVLLDFEDHPRGCGEHFKKNGSVT